MKKHRNTNSSVASSSMPSSPLRSTPSSNSANNSASSSSSSNHATTNPKCVVTSSKFSSIFAGSGLATPNGSLLMQPVSLTSMVPSPSSSAAALAIVTPCNSSSSNVPSLSDKESFRANSASVFPKSTNSILSSSSSSSSSSKQSAKNPEDMFAHSSPFPPIGSMAALKSSPLSASSAPSAFSSPSASQPSAPSTANDQTSQANHAHHHHPHQQQQHHHHAPPRKKQSTRDPLSHRMIEKRRRDRMNNCLTDLSRLIPNSFIKKQSSSLQNRGRIEKTEIIEMAIKYLKHLQSIAEPLLIEDGPLGPSPTTTPLPSIDHDQLFMLCNSHSQNTATLLIKDRYQFYQLGYQECFSETVHFLEENGLENLYGKLVDHLHAHRDSISVGIVSKHMMNPATMVNFEDSHAKALQANSPTLSVNNTNFSIHYVPKVSTSEVSNVDSNASFVFDNLMSTASSTSSNNSVSNISSVLGVPGAKAGFSAVDNEESSVVAAAAAAAFKSQYSLNTFKFLMDASAKSSSAATNPPSELSASVDQHSSCTNTTAVSVTTASSASLTGGGSSTGTTQANTNDKNCTSSLNDSVNSSGHTGKVASPNNIDLITKTKSKSDSSLCEEQIAAHQAGKTSKSLNSLTSNEVYNFKKEIKDRFQKVMDRMSDGSRNSSSVSSFNSETTEVASTGNSTDFAPMSASQQGYPLTSVITTPTKTPSASSEYSGRNSANELSEVLSEAKSHTNEDQEQLSESHHDLYREQPNKLASYSPSNPSSSAKSVPDYMDSNLYKTISAKLLMTLSSLISTFSSSSSPSSTPTSSSSVNFVPVFALHPSGQYYVPLRVEASILGFGDSSLFRSACEGTKTSFNEQIMTSSKGKRSQSDGDGKDLNGDVDHEHSSYPSAKRSRTESNENHADQDPHFGGSFINTKLKVNCTNSSVSPKENDKRFYEEDCEKTVLYPINITVNIAFNRTVSLANLFASIKQLLTVQLNATIDGQPVNDTTNLSSRKLNGPLEDSSDNKSTENMSHSPKVAHDKSGSMKPSVIGAPSIDMKQLNNMAAQLKNEMGNQTTATQMMMMLAAAAAAMEDKTIGSNKSVIHNDLAGSRRSRSTNSPVKETASSRNVPPNLLPKSAINLDEIKSEPEGTERVMLNSKLSTFPNISYVGQNTAAKLASLSKVASPNDTSPSSSNTSLAPSAGLTPNLYANYSSAVAHNGGSDMFVSSGATQSEALGNGLPSAYLPHSLASQLSYYSLWSSQLASHYPSIDFQANHKAAPLVLPTSTASSLLRPTNPNPFMMSLFSNGQMADFTDTTAAAPPHQPPSQQQQQQLKSQFDCYNQLFGPGQFIGPNPQPTTFDHFTALTSKKVAPPHDVLKHLGAPSTVRTTSSVTPTSTGMSHHHHQQQQQHHQHNHAHHQQPHHNSDNSSQTNLKTGPEHESKPLGTPINLTKEGPKLNSVVNI